MSSFPKIDSPCPLRWKAPPAAGRDFCTHCRRRVHDLDGMSEGERRALLNGCGADICVSYTVPRRRIAAAGIAAALSFGAVASDIPTDRSSVPIQAIIPTEPKADCATDAETHMEVEVLLGGISHAREAEWLSAGNLPDLPTAGSGAFVHDMEFVAAPAPSSE
ncbi:MAG: hypothetical protein AMXMBFR59_29470 [Rhodanobacteraceae bacterium]